LKIKVTLTDGSIRHATQNSQLIKWVEDGLIIEDTILIDEENGAELVAKQSIYLKPTFALLRSRLQTSGEKACPFCAETIKAEAKVCRYCGRDLPMAGEDPQAYRQIDNSVFWTMAFLPLIGVAVELALSGPLSMKVSDLWWVTVVLNVIFIAVDIDKVKNAGFKTEGLAVAAIFLFPVYMFMRGERTKSGPAAGIVWIVIFLLALVWAMGIGAAEALQGVMPQR